VTVNVKPAMVIVAVRGDVAVFAPVAHITVVVPVPTLGEVTVRKALLLRAVHPQADALAVSPTAPEEMADGTDADDAESEKLHVTTVMTAVFESAVPSPFVTRTQ
jgi:hypothetical protein